MKKTLCVIWVLVLLLSLPACTSSKEDIQEPAFFYYRQSELSYGTTPGVVAKEAREVAGHKQDYSHLLSVYLKGPESYTLYNPFPGSTSLRSFSMHDGTAFVHLSSSFASLTGLDLTLACACITLTVCEMTGVQQVTISADGVLLDGNPQITMTPDGLLMMDDSNIVIPPE